MFHAVRPKGRGGQTSSRARWLLPCRVKNPIISLTRGASWPLGSPPAISIFSTSFSAWKWLERLLVRGCRGNSWETSTQLLCPRNLPIRNIKLLCGEVYGVVPSTPQRHRYTTSNTGNICVRRIGKDPLSREAWESLGNFREVVWDCVGTFFPPSFLTYYVHTGAVINPTTRTQTPASVFQKSFKPPKKSGNHDHKVQCVHC